MLLKKLTYTLLLIGITLFAEVEDKWKISVGSMFITNYETDMQLNKKGLPLGIKISTTDELEQKSDDAVFRFDGYYRFNDKHSIAGSYFGVKSSGHKISEIEFEWNDDTIEAGSTIESYFNVDVYKINYGYSFYHNDRVELTLTAGLHVTEADIGLSAEGTINGQPASKASSSDGVTAPLPTLGFKGEYTIIPSYLFIDYKTEFFYLDFDTYKGSLVSSALNLEYRFIDHVGIGIGFNYNHIYVEEEDGDKRVEIESILSGIMLNLTYIY